MSAVSPDIVAAYRAAVYEVDDAFGSIRIQIDTWASESDSLLRRAGVDTGFFITAYNPASIALCDAENLAAHETLEVSLRQIGVTYLTARGLDPTDRWPPEAGFFVLGLARDDALGLARRFDQNGIVWVATGRAPELVLLR